MAGSEEDKADRPSGLPRGQSRRGLLWYVIRKCYGHTSFDATHVNRRAGAMHGKVNRTVTRSRPRTLSGEKALRSGRTAAHSSGGGRLAIDAYRLHLPSLLLSL